MRNQEIKPTGTRFVLALTIAATLLLNAGSGHAQNKKSPPPPPKPVVPARQPQPRTVPAPVTRPATPTTRTPTPAPNSRTTPVPSKGPVARPVPNNLPKPSGGGTVRPTPHVPGPAAHPGPGGTFHGANGIEGKVDPKSHRVKMVSKTEPDGSRTVVHNSPTGVRHIENVSRDSYGHSIRTVSDGHRGYRERELVRRPGYRERTYYDHGHAYAVVYHDRVYGRYGAYPVFVPVYYYHPAFYAYFGSPWGTPVAFGWGGYPGYAYYGAYFAPPPSYASPDAWMADYIISQNLQANYAAQQDASADAQAAGDQGQVEAQTAAPQPIPQDVRDAYVAQVKAAVQEAATEAAGQTPTDTVPGALSPDFRVFQSYSDVEAQMGGQECSLTGGDFIRREEDTPDGSKTVAVTVVTIAKPTASHCPANARVRLSVETLQDWYNSFAQSQQAGYEALAANQGKNGFPPVPDTGRVTNPAGQATPDDAGVLATAIQQQGTNATTLQAEATGNE